MSTTITVQRQVPASSECYDTTDNLVVDFSLDAIDQAVLDGLVCDFIVPSLSGPLADYKFCFDRRSNHQQPIITVKAIQSYRDRFVIQRRESDDLKGRLNIVEEQLSIVEEQFGIIHKELQERRKMEVQLVTYTHLGRDRRSSFYILI